MRRIAPSASPKSQESKGLAEPTLSALHVVLKMKDPFTYASHALKATTKAKISSFTRNTKRKQKS